MRKALCKSRKNTVAKKTQALCLAQTPDIIFISCYWILDNNSSIVFDVISVRAYIFPSPPTYIHTCRHSARILTLYPCVRAYLQPIFIHVYTVLVFGAYIRACVHFSFLTNLYPYMRTWCSYFELISIVLTGGAKTPSVRVNVLTFDPQIHADITPKI